MNRAKAHPKRGDPGKSAAVLVCSSVCPSVDHSPARPCFRCCRRAALRLPVIQCWHCLRRAVFLVRRSHPVAPVFRPPRACYLCYPPCLLLTLVPRHPPRLRLHRMARRPLRLPPCRLPLPPLPPVRLHLRPGSGIRRQQLNQERHRRQAPVVRPTLLPLLPPNKPPISRPSACGPSRCPICSARWP